MRTKNFYDILEERLTKEQIAEIERKAQLEVDVFRSIQKKNFFLKNKRSVQR